MRNTPRLEISRRRFLGSMSVVVAAALVTPKLGQAAARKTPTWVEIVRRLADAEPMAAIGRAYLRKHPEYPSVESVVVSLSKGGLSILGSDAQEEEIMRTLESTIREDFAIGRIAVVKGWWLAETEAQICALVALLI